MRRLFLVLMFLITHYIINTYTTHCATSYISCVPLRALRRFRVTAGIRTPALCLRTSLRSSYRFAFRCPCICPCRHGHLPGRLKSLYSKHLFDTSRHIVYKLRVSPCFALSKPSPVFPLPALADASAFVLIPVCLQMSEHPSMQACLSAQPPGELI